MKMFVQMSLMRIRNGFYHSKRHMGFINNRSQYWREQVGDREMVGYGANGFPIYFDTPNFPFPALRYKEITGDLQALFEKQKGNWNELTIDEKKALYRASFCQTFAEFKASKGQWMEIIGHSLILSSLGIWLFILYQIFIAPPKPESFRPSHVRAQMRRLIDMQNNPVYGIASKWDYEKNDWKEYKWNTPPNPFLKYPDDP